MKNPRPLIFVIFGALIVIGAVLILQPFLNPPQMIPPRLEPPNALPAGDVPFPNIVRVKVGEARAAHETYQVVFVDVRDRDAYQRGHIPGALALPLDELENRLGELDKQQWIIAYCT